MSAACCISDRWEMKLSLCRFSVLFRLCRQKTFRKHVAGTGQFVLYLKKSQIDSFFSAHLILVLKEPDQRLTGAVTQLVYHGCWQIKIHGAYPRAFREQNEKKWLGQLGPQHPRQMTGLNPDFWKRSMNCHPHLDAGVRRQPAWKKKALTELMTKLNFALLFSARISGVTWVWIFLRIQETIHFKFRHSWRRIHTMVRNVQISVILTNYQFLQQFFLWSCDSFCCWHFFMVDRSRFYILNFSHLFNESSFQLFGDEKSSVCFLYCFVELVTRQMPCALETVTTRLLWSLDVIVCGFVKFEDKLSFHFHFHFAISWKSWTLLWRPRYAKLGTTSSNMSQQSISQSGLNFGLFL